MTSAVKLVYSDNLLSAFAAAVIRSYQQQMGGKHYLGRTAIQKLLYFTKTLGVPIPCSFEIYAYGPYSDSVTFSVDSMLADDVIRDISPMPQKYSNYRLGENGDQVLKTYGADIEPYQKAIDAVVRSLGNFEPNQLELVSTLHFIHQRLKNILQKEPAEQQVFAEFTRVKKDKFPPEEVKSFYDALKGAQLI